jgi:hypothetical protein
MTNLVYRRPVLQGMEPSARGRVDILPEAARI